MKEKEIEAILFDVDGTLLNSTELIFQAYEHTLATHGLSPRTRQEISSMIGKPLEEIYSHFAPQSDSAELCETHRSFQEQNLHLSTPFPGVPETLKNLKELGLKIAAITTRSRRTSIKTLELGNLIDLFDVIISLEDISNQKPHPEPLLKALQNLQVEPERAIMVGDTDADILAGKNASTKTIGVTYGFHGERIKKSNPNHVIDEITDIIPIILIELKALEQE